MSHNPTNNQFHGTVKIVNPHSGKGEIIHSLLPTEVGKLFNSTKLNGKALHSEWSINYHYTDKGSVKIDDIWEYVPYSPTSPTVESVQPTDLTVESPIVPVESPTVDTPEIIAPIALTKDIELWDSPDYYISPEIKLAFGVMYRMLQTNPYKCRKAILGGDSGYGKTTVAEQLANYTGLKFLRVNCATMRDATEWFGQYTVESSSMKWIDSDFMSVLRQGNVVIVLDEFNRIPTDFHNSLFPLLDDSQQTTVYNQIFKVGPNVLFIATVNQGSKYGGTFGMDQAIVNRFEFCVEVGPLPFDTEVALLETRRNVSATMAEQIVSMAKEIRDNSHLGVVCSTRTTLLVADMVANGLSVRDAFEFAVVRRIPRDDANLMIRKAICDMCNTKIGVSTVLNTAV